MEEIVLQQRNAPKAVTGKGFLLGVAGVIVKLALAQLVVNALIALTGIGLLNIAFYLYAVLVLVRFMTRSVAGSTYTLKEDSLTLQKLLGDSTVSVTEIPFEKIISVRPVLYGDRLKSSYRTETVIDAQAGMPLRMKAAFALSLFSASLARKTAGQMAYAQRGMVIVYEEEGKKQAYVFLPDEAMADALCAALPGKYGVDERAQGNVPVSMMAQALGRAFPDLYEHVEPLLSAERVEAAKKEIERQKQARDAKKAQPAAAHTEKTEEEAGEQDEVQNDSL